MKTQMFRTKKWLEIQFTLLLWSKCSLSFKNEDNQSFRINGVISMFSDQFLCQVSFLFPELFNIFMSLCVTLLSDMIVVDIHSKQIIECFQCPGSGVNLTTSTYSDSSIQPPFYL